MDELKRMLERKADEIRLDQGMPASVRTRYRRRRLGTALASLAIVAGLGIGAYAGAQGLMQGAPRPGGGPAIGPTYPTPDAEPVDVHVLGAAPGLDEGGLVAYLDLILNPQQRRYEIATAEETEGSEVTVVIYRPGFENEARALRDDAFPGVELRSEDQGSRTPLQIVIGEDFERRHGQHVKNLMAAYDFMVARVRGQEESVEPRLSQTAAGQFERHVGGLDLYTYAERATFDVLVLSREDERTTSIHVRIRQPDDQGHREVFETLRIGDEDGDGALEVVSAERNR